MKKLYFSMLLMAGLTLTACSSDDNSTEPQATKTYYMTVDATKGVNEAFSRMSRRALSLTGSTLSASWETSEKVYVEGQLTGGDYFWFNNYIQPQSVGKNTRLNGAITLPEREPYTSYEKERRHTLTLQFPRICTGYEDVALRAGDLDYDSQKGTLADIAANYDYATATIDVDVIDNRIVPYLDYEENPVEFKNHQAIVKFTLKKSDGTTLMNPSALTIQYGDKTLSLTDIPDATYTTNGNGVLFVAIPGFEEKKVILTATVGEENYTFTRSGVTFNDGKYYEINVKMKQ